MRGGAPQKPQFSAFASGMVSTITHRNPSLIFEKYKYMWDYEEWVKKKYTQSFEEYDTVASDGVGIFSSAEAVDGEDIENSQSDQDTSNDESALQKERKFDDEMRSELPPQAEVITGS